MCFSPAASLAALIFSNVVALYLYTRNKLYDRWNAGFIFVFSLIQLAEYFLWTSNRSNDNQSANATNFSYSNNTITRFIFLALVLQPLIQCYGAFLSYHGKDKVMKNMLLFAVIAYVVFFLYAIVYSIRGGSGMYSTKGDSGHLEWHNTESSCGGLLCGFMGAIYLVGILAPLFTMGAKSIPLLLAGGLGAAISLKMANSDPTSFGSLWCFFAVGYSAAALLV